MFSPDDASTNRSATLLVMLLATAIFIYAYLPGFTNPYIVNNDVRAHIFWMQQWQDPTLYQHDWLVDYARYYVPWGIKGIYWLASFVVNPLHFSNILPGFLFVLLSVTMFQIGALMVDRRLGWFTVSVFWLMPFFLAHLGGGLPRAFAAPLLALFWYFWLAGSSRGMALTMVLQALCIPYIFPVCAGAVTIGWALGKLKRIAPPPFPASATDLACLALACGLVVFFSESLNRSGYGPLVTAVEMVDRPEFMFLGRLAILPVPTLFWEFISPWEWIAPFHWLGNVWGGLVCGVLVIVALWGVRQVQWRSLVPRLPSVWCLGLSSLLCYALARIFLPKMHVPDRYLISTFNLFYCVALALSFQALTTNILRTRRMSIVALSLVVVLSGFRLQGAGLDDYTEYSSLYRALRQIPKDALVAGHPDLMDNVLTFAQRRVLVSTELAQPWSKALWEQLRPRLEDLFAAYYAAQPEEVKAFCRKYGISYLVVDERHFTPAFLAHRPFFKPFDAYIRQLTQGRREFALLSREHFPGAKVDDHVWVVNMKDSAIPTGTSIPGN